jgi:ribosomal protein L22
MKYAIQTKEKVRASSTLSISPINASKVCKVLNRKKFGVSKKFLEDLINKKISINGKYYTKTVKEISKVLNQLENNAKSLSLDADSLNLFISAHKGPTMYRSRRDRGHGIRLKSSHIQAVLSEKNGFGKKIRERSNKK